MSERSDAPDELIRPRQLTGTVEFPVHDELVLRPPPGHGAGRQAAGQAVALNESGRAIWELCDGQHSVGEILRIIADRFPGSDDRLYGDVKDVLSRFRQLGLVELVSAVRVDRPNVKFVIGIEDRVEFHWQTPVFLESLSGKLPHGWTVCVVVCNDHAPLSRELGHILTAYNAEHLTGTNFSKTDAFGNAIRGHSYGPLNRVEALSVAASRVAEDDLVCLLDADIFLYEAINPDVIPKTNALADSWHLKEEVFFSTVADGKGVDLNKLLESLGCRDRYKGGGVNVFVEGSVLRQAKFIEDCFRFTQVLYLLGRIAGIDNVWMSEMPCFGLALTANGVAYDLLDAKELQVSDGDEDRIPPGTFYHYYSDPADPGGCAAFRDSKWHKQLYRDVDLLRTDFSRFRAEAATDHERYFFQLATRAQERLYGSNAQTH